MSRATVTINNQTVLDQNIDQWQQQPPPFLAELAKHKTGNKPQPHLQAILAALVHSITSAQPVNINVTTNNQGWSMTVTHDHLPFVKTS